MQTVMTVEEVARLLKVSGATIYREVEKGLLPGFKIGRQWRFRQEELENFIQERSSWRRKFQSLLDELQKEGAKKDITEKIVSQEITAVRGAKRRRKR